MKHIRILIFELTTKINFDNQNYSLHGENDFAVSI